MNDGKLATEVRTNPFLEIRPHQGRKTADEPILLDGVHHDPVASLRWSCGLFKGIAAAMGNVANVKRGFQIFGEKFFSVAENEVLNISRHFGLN